MGKFSESVFKGIRHKTLEALPEEEKKEIKLQKTEDCLNKISNKENRFLFYCPDIPFPVGTVKTIYQHVQILNELGYKAEVIHEVEGYRPTWMDTEFENMRKVPVKYLTRKKGKKMNYEFPFQPTDTIIVPDGFWSVMQGFYNAKQIQKVTFVMGYGGIATIEPGLNWQVLGFNDAICVSDQLVNDYKTLWPNINYYKAGYSINTEVFKPLKNAKDKQPLISLSCRSREDAQRIINIFYGKYPFLDMFQFDIVKKKSTREYAECLRNSILLVLNDIKSGHPQWPLEAIASNTPTLLINGRGYEHIKEHKDIITLPEDDDFLTAEVIAEFCLNWLQKDHFEEETDKSILENYKVENLRGEIDSIYSDLSNKLNQKFVALKNTILKQEEETVNEG